MRVALVLVLVACVTVSLVNAGPARNGLNMVAMRLRANIAMVNQALEICEAELEGTTDELETGSQSNDAASGGASGQNGNRITGRVIAALNQELRDALQELEDCKDKLQETMGGTTEAQTGTSSSGAQSGAQSGGMSK